MAWINNDGLKVKFDRELVEQQQPRGEAPGAGAYRIVDVILDLADLTATVPYVWDDTIVPRNSTIVSATVENIVARSGGTSLAFGLQEYDGTEFDYDGFFAANTQDSIGQRTEYFVGTSGAGALVGTKTAIPGLLTVTATGTFTTGRVALRVKLFVPGKDALPHNFVTPS